MRRRYLDTCGGALLVASALAGLSSGEANAWSGPGHAAVAVMAYRELADEPTLRSALVELLASHPRYAVWKEQYDAAQPTLPSSIDLGAFLFVRASTWPDEIRRTDVLELQRFDHPNWHYVDYPLRPPTFETGPSPTPEDDVLFGIAASNATLADASAPPADRAAALSWLIHLIGDAHQPCHAATLVTEQFPPPGGDQGGNFFWIYQNAAQKNANLKTKMHAYWDGRLGTDWVPDPVEALGNAKMLTARHPRSTLDELAHGGDVAAWTFESRDAAASHVYRFKGKMLRQKRVLPSGYVTNSHRVARRRLALAGYRLADDLGKTAPTP